MYGNIHARVYILVKWSSFNDRADIYTAVRNSGTGWWSAGHRFFLFFYFDSDFSSLSIAAETTSNTKRTHKLHDNCKNGHHFNSTISWVTKGSFRRQPKIKRCRFDRRLHPTLLLIAWTRKCSHWLWRIRMHLYSYKLIGRRGYVLRPAFLLGRNPFWSTTALNHEIKREKKSNQPSKYTRVRMWYMFRSRCQI